MAAQKNYIEPISAADAARYDEKLTVHGKRLPDPYYEIPSFEWKKDLDHLPSVTFPDIYVYCVLKKSMYTNEQLCAYRSLEAHNYFTNGFVQEIWTKAYKVTSPEEEKNLVFMKANVLPSQRVGQKAKPYVTWSLSYDTGEMVSAHCTCMAGLDETCSHVVALLFKAQAAVMMGLNQRSVTSSACKWNSTFRKNVQAQKVKNMQLTMSGNQAKRRSVSCERAFLSAEKRQKIENDSRKFGALHGCAFMTCVDESGQLVQNLSELPFTIMKMCDMTRLSDTCDVCPSFCEQLVDRLPQMFRDEQLAALEAKSRAQSSSKVWHDHRHGRITASMFGDVLRAEAAGGEGASLVQAVCGRKGFSGAGPPSLRWGREKEPVALERLVAVLAQTHTGVQYHAAGLVVTSEFPFLGASPDGFITCECESCPGKRVVEVKCPYTMRDQEPSRAPYLESDGSLNNGHAYHAQVQGQLLMTGLDECWFAVFTNVGLHVTVIRHEPTYTSNMVKVLRKFYVQKVLPALLKK